MRKRVAVCVCVVVGMLGCAPSAFAALGDVQTPIVSGPVTGGPTGKPFGGTDIDLAKYGYTEQEYLVSGNAYAYLPGADPKDTATKITTGGPANDGLWPYVTRITVRRPISPADFNGTTIVEWNNVTAQFDLEANWDGDPYYLLKHGYAWVGVSAQRVGVSNSLLAKDLKTVNPARYSGLSIPDPTQGPGAQSTDTDGLSFEIYSAAIKALLGAGNGVDPLAGLSSQTIIASGESQSGSRLGRYYNQIQPLHELVDGFLLTVSTTALRTDRSEKVIRVLSENENKNTQAETDNANLRHWEVAGASHLPQMAYRNFQGPVERDIGFTLSATCQKNPLSRVEWPFVVNAAVADLTSWANGGAAPPTAARGTYSAPNTLARDSYGIAEGAIRLPAVTVPVATNTGINATGAGATDLFSAFCPLLGSSETFAQPTLDGLYTDFGDYIDKVGAAAQSVSSQGYVLPEDATRLVDEASQFPQLRPTAPATSGANRRGSLTLGWRGTTAPDTTFSLQHSKKAGSKGWSDVSGAGALTAQTFSFAKASALERDGKWRYRVKSTTNVPATPIATAYTVVTSYSDASPVSIVDTTKPKVKVTCPRKVRVGAKAFAHVRASDATTGLRRKPKRKIRIRTSNVGKRVTKVTAVDKTGNRRSARCVTRVVAS